MLTNLLLLNVEHYALTAWIFFGVIACLIVSFFSVALSLKAVLQTRKSSRKKKRKKLKLKKTKKSESKPEAKTVTKFCDESKGQYLGFLETKTGQLRKHVNFNIPSNCLHCNFLVKCQGLDKKRGLRKLVPFLFVLFLCTMTLTPLVAADAESELIAETSLTVFGEHEWIHVRVAGDQVGSVAWEGYGTDVQLIFYAYNDSGLSFDQFVIEPQKSYSDPFGRYRVYWNGTKNFREELMLKVYSFQGQTTTIVDSFVGETPHYGRPGTRYKKVTSTHENEIFDVFRDKDDEHLCSFEWSMISRTNNATNSTESLPSLTVYNPDGTKYDNRWLSATMQPLVEYWDLVGFMVDSMGDDYVKWVVYSDYELRVAINQGFEDMELPHFSVNPVGLRVNPGDVVSVSFVLPDDVADYSVSWTEREIWDHITLLRDEVVDGEHVVEFKFSESIFGSKNSRDVTLSVECSKYGTSYSGSAVVRVSHPDYSAVILLVALIPVGIVTIIGLWYFLGRRRERTNITEVNQETFSY